MKRPSIEEEIEDEVDGLDDFTWAAARAAKDRLERIVHDDEERNLMMQVVEYLATDWDRESIFYTACFLGDKEIPVERMMQLARSLTRRRIITGAEVAWLKDQLASAGAEFAGEKDAALRRIRRLPVPERRRAVAKRLLELKVMVLRQSGEPTLAKLLERTPLTYADRVATGGRSVQRLLGTRAA